MRRLGVGKFEHRCLSAITDELEGLEHLQASRDTAKPNQSLVDLTAIWSQQFNHMGGKFLSMTKRLADIIMEVLDELGATEMHPLHGSVFNQIVAKRWKRLGNKFGLKKDFRQTINEELQRFGPKSKEWRPKLFRMHGGGYWSIRNDASRGIEQQWRKEVAELWISIHT